MILKNILAALSLLLSLNLAFAQVIINPTSVGTAPPGQVPGTATNDAAAAGKVGEVLINSTLVGAAISLTTTTAVNINSGITLTPGDWDVYLYASFVPAVGTSVTQYMATISQTTGTLDVATPFAFNQQSFAAQIPGGLSTTISVGPVKINVANGATVPVFPVIRSIFSASTMTAFGAIKAERVR